MIRRITPDDTPGLLAVCGSTGLFPPDEIVVSSANMHLIPATREVDRTLRNLPVGGLVHLEGALVDASKGKWTWRTSRTRTDTGPGACELFYVEQASTY